MTGNRSIPEDRDKGIGKTYNMNRKEIKSWLYFLLPIVGTVLAIGYILAATEDVVYSDYIRLVNSYLPDVWDLKKFFVADILTRMPVNFLERIINVSFFGYSTRFDMVLGALCLGLSAFVLSAYCQRRQIGTGWYILLMGVLFSLNKWEMLTNGTGWCHFLAFAGFYVHYLVFDNVWRRKQEGEFLPEKEERRDKRERRLLMVLPWLIILGTAGPYCASYAAVLVLVYGICFFLDGEREILGGKGEMPGKTACSMADRGKKRRDFRYMLYAIHVLCPFALYLISNSFAVTEHAGTTGRSIGEVLGDNLILFPKFIIKSFSSMVAGEEVMMELLKKLDMGMALCYLAGGLVLAGYLLALWMQVKKKLYCVSILPLMLIFAGGMNHLLVLAARWIFENSDYGMSSRYALQYQAGIFGILLTFGLFSGLSGQKGQFKAVKVATVLISLAILAGNGYTTGMELKKAPHRKAYGAQVAEAALGFRDVPDGELENLFQYRHGPEKIRNALRILEENQWNVYRKR